MTASAILLVDDEEKALKYLRLAFEPKFRVFSANSAAAALDVLARHHREIGVIVTDQRMPETTGLQLLNVVRRLYPRTVRILTTAYTELDLLIEAINTGAVYSFVSKPWQLTDLERTLTSALEHYEASVRDHSLLEEKLDEFREHLLEGRTREVASVAAKIGHYVHNALCPVTLLLDDLLDENNPESRLPRDFLERVQAHVQQIARTLKDLAAISVPPRPEDFTTIDLHDILESALEATAVLRDEKRIEVITAVAAKLPVIRGVPGQIDKLFRFMLTEEIVSLTPGSRFALRLRPTELDAGPPGVQLEVEDFEPLPDHVCREDIVHPFSVRGANPREFGIFLASSYFIAQHHGGSLHVTIKDDQSLLFSFFLPSDPGTMGTGREVGQNAASDARE